MHSLRGVRYWRRVCSYAFDTECPVLTWAMLLPGRGTTRGRVGADATECGAEEESQVQVPVMTYGTDSDYAAPRCEGVAEYASWGKALLSEPGTTP
eukprot:3160196-Rhodomonas_salina.1